MFVVVVVVVAANLKRKYLFCIYTLLAGSCNVYFSNKLDLLKSQEVRTNIVIGGFG